MSSNIKINLVCQHCGQKFIAGRLNAINLSIRKTRILRKDSDGMFINPIIENSPKQESQTQQNRPPLKNFNTSITPNTQRFYFIEGGAQPVVADYNKNLSIGQFFRWNDEKSRV